jgi:hypothetical protein
MLHSCIQTSYDQNVQLILKSYLPVVLGTTLIYIAIQIHYVTCLYHNNVQNDFLNGQLTVYYI